MTGETGTGGQGQDLSVEHRCEGTIGVVVAGGVLDAASVPRLRDALLRSAAAMPDAVVADLDGLRPERPRLLSVLAEVRRQLARWPGIPLLLACSREPLFGCLRSKAGARSVPTHPSVAAAVAAVGERPARRRTSLDLPGDPGSSRRARRWLGEVCAGWGLPDLPDAVLVTSELVENMVTHAGTGGVLRVELRDALLSIAVSDADPRPPSLVTADTTAAGGRGIAVVDALSRAWGHHPRAGGGKVVWAVVPATEEPDSLP